MARHVFRGASVVPLIALLAAPVRGAAVEDAPAPDHRDASSDAAAAPPASETVVATSERGDGRPELTEEIVVTGSRVPRKDVSTPAPVTVFTREEILGSGRATIGEFLQLMPEQGNALNRQINNGGDGSTRIGLRSLGDQRTLVLLNGRRYVAAGVGADRSVDLNTIPTAAVERIEILKDGASPIYGSDAMGGVVNIITRKRWSGVEAASRVGVSSRGDAESYGASLTAGSAQDAGSYLVTASYVDLGSAMAGDRWFTARPVFYDYETGGTFSAGSGIVPPGTIVLNPMDPADRAPNGNPCWDALVAAYPAASRFIQDPAATDTCGWRPLNRTALAGEGGDLYNYQPENYAVTPLRILSLFAIGDRRLGDAARLYFEASYVSRRSDQMLAPLPLTTGAEGVTVSRDNAYNPFGRDFAEVRRRLVEIDRRRFAQDVDTFRIVGGLDGAFPDGSGVLAGWGWDVSASYGRTNASQQVSGFLTASGLADALGPSVILPGPDGVLETPSHGTLRGDDVAVCGTAAAPIPGCVPLDLFNGVGSITPDMVNSLTYTGTTTGESELRALQANATGTLFRLAAERPVGLAAGYEYRNVFGRFVPDTMAMRGDRRDVRQQPTRGTADVHEAYAELSVPVASGATLAEEVELLAAARAFKHGRFEPDWTWKLGARWKPVRDVTLRGTASTAYRVPSIQELFQGETLGDSNFTGDPCASLEYDPVFNPFMTPERRARCLSAGVPVDGTGQFGAVPAPVMGNAALEPETARVFTAGIVLEPRFVEGLSLALDYWDVRVESVIGPIFPSMILDLCYPNRADATPRLCELVDRDPATGQLRGVSDPVVNSGGEERAAGVDLAVRWRVGTPVGRITASLDVGWLRWHDVEQEDGTVLHGRGTYDLYFQPTALTGLNPEWKYGLGVAWGLGGVAAGASVRHLSGFEECGSYDPFQAMVLPDACSFPLWGASSRYSRQVSSWTALDAFVEYELATGAGRTRLGAGVMNALDEPPPFVSTSWTPYSDASGYDMLGRYLYGRISHRF